MTARFRLLASVLAIVLTPACRERYPESFHDCRDFPRDEPARTPDLTGYAEGELFDDERALAQTPECSPPKNLVDDDELRASCEVSARAAARPVACRTACVAFGRERMAVMLYDTIVAQLGVLHARLEERKHTTCRKALQTANTAQGDASRNVWHCLGLVDLPKRARITMTFHPVVVEDTGTTLSVGQGDLEYVGVSADLVPHGSFYTFTLARAGKGCKTTGWQVWTRKAMREPPTP
jgi:hypothetical protein